MIEETFLICSFASSHQAIKAETLATRQGLPARLVPLHPSISAGCGLALRLAMEFEAPLRELLAEAGIQGELYRMHRMGTTRTVEKLED